MVMLRYCLILLTLSLCSCVRFPYPPVEPKTEINNQESSVWLIAGQLHSDIVVETKWLTKYNCRLPKSLSQYKYLCFGWGDKVAYTERWGISDIPNALFWPSESIVQVIAFNTDVEPTFPEDTVVKAIVPDKNGAPLSNFINHSFSFSEPSSNTPITLSASKWGYGYFIKSPYSYYFPRMCNQWISNALMEAGIYTTKPSAIMSSQTLKKQMVKYNEERQTSIYR